VRLRSVASFYTSGEVVVHLLPGSQSGSRVEVQNRVRYPPMRGPVGQGCFWAGMVMFGLGSVLIGIGFLLALVARDGAEALRLGGGLVMVLGLGAFVAWTFRATQQRLQAEGEREVGRMCMAVRRVLDVEVA